MVKNREINGTEEIALATPTPALEVLNIELPNKMKTPGCPTKLILHICL